MIWPKEASLSIKSAKPGAVASVDTADSVGDDADRSTSTTFAVRASILARVSAVSVMLAPSPVPSTVIFRALSPAERNSWASRSISVTPAPNSGCTFGTDEAIGTDGAAGSGGAAAVGTGVGDVAPGAVMRSSSPVAIQPAVSISDASVAIRTIGIFFG